ncbi:hypothetical protein GLOIN_2v1485529 [Rhizophagus clarus]|uniref:Uncharacterized protein n=1 Tax=Rhizophagus clarus TaxID=94130 RepID=A0A8H3R8Z2_9GLOM|nr:hypothetical protein GLOIN_2v1485529 [Rhizophagus clarus]
MKIDENFITSYNEPVYVKIANTSANTNEYQGKALLVSLNPCILVEKLENKLKEYYSIVLSAIDFKSMQQIRYIEWFPTKMQVMILSHQMFTWSKLVKDAQSDEYMKYIKEVIKLPSGLEWYNVKKNQKFFNSTNQKWLPFSLKGTTDIAILTKGYLGCMDQKYVRFRIVIELKKVGNVDAKAHFQTQGELITANHWSNHKVLAILQECIDVESSDFKKNLKFEDDYPFIKRRKLNTTNIGASDVVDLNDFVNVCPR